MRGAEFHGTPCAATPLVSRLLSGVGRANTEDGGLVDERKEVEDWLAKHGG